jgi:hypothetical protein
MQHGSLQEVRFQTASAAAVAKVLFDQDYQELHVSYV